MCSWGTRLKQQRLALSHLLESNLELRSAGEESLGRNAKCLSPTWSELAPNQQRVLSPQEGHVESQRAAGPLARRPLLSTRNRLPGAQLTAANNPEFIQLSRTPLGRSTVAVCGRNQCPQKTGVSPLAVRGWLTLGWQDPPPPESGPEQRHPRRSWLMS